MPALVMLPTSPAHDELILVILMFFIVPSLKRLAGANMALYACRSDCCVSVKALWQHK
jgi:hypothetical protein